MSTIFIKKFKKLPKLAFYFVFAVFLTLGLSISLQSLLAAWVAPASTPPNGNAPAPLNVSSTGQAKDAGLILNHLGASQNGLIVGAGNVGIGTTSPTQKLEVAGNVKANQYCIGVSCVSDWATLGGDNLGNHTASSNIDLNDLQLVNARGIQFKDWDDDTGGTDNKYRILARDGAMQFFNGGVVVGSYANDTWADLADGTLIVEGNVGIGAINPGKQLVVAESLTGAAGSYTNQPTFRLTQMANLSYSIGDVHSALEFYSEDSSWGEGLQAYIAAVTTRGNISHADAGLYIGTSNGATKASYTNPQMVIKHNGLVGIGTANPGAMLEVAGQVKITGGTPGAGKVFTSDASGLGSWETPAAQAEADTLQTVTSRGNTTSLGLIVNGQTLNHEADNFFYINSYNGLQLRVNSDGAGTNNFQINNSANDTIFKISDSGTITGAEGFSVNAGVTTGIYSSTGVAPFSRLSVDSLHTNGLGYGQMYIEGSAIDANSTIYIGMGNAGGRSAATVRLNNPQDQNGNTIWHAGNDGSGSGLDADTLDGLDSTEISGYYMNLGEDYYEYWNTDNGVWDCGSYSGHGDTCPGNVNNLPYVCAPNEEINCKDAANTGSCAHHRNISCRKAKVFTDPGTQKMSVSAAEDWGRVTGTYIGANSGGDCTLTGNCTNLANITKWDIALNGTLRTNATGGRPGIVLGSCEVIYAYAEGGGYYWNCNSWWGACACDWYAGPYCTAGTLKGPSFSSQWTTYMCVQ